MIYLSHLPPSNNTGDNAADPSRYFDLRPLKRIERHQLPPTGAALLIAGGGLWGCDQERAIGRQVEAAGKVIAWGAGTNYPYAGEFAAHPPWLIQPKVLLGTRDAGCGLPWVPCPSCMHPFFDDPPAPTRAVVVYHGKHPIEARGAPAQRCNEGLPIDTAMAFLASARAVVTSSYHGMYWASLLGRRVIVVNPDRNSKFYRWPFSRVTLGAGVDWRTAVESAVPCEGALAVCREANRRFAEQVRLSLDSLDKPNAKPVDQPGRCNK